MYTQDLNLSFLYETERRKDEMAQALESCRANQLCPKRSAKSFNLVRPVFLNLLVLLAALFKRHA